MPQYPSAEELVAILCKTPRSGLGTAADHLREQRLAVTLPDTETLVVSLPPGFVVLTLQGDTGVGEYMSHREPNKTLVAARAEVWQRIYQLPPGVALASSSAGTEIAPAILLGDQLIVPPSLGKNGVAGVWLGDPSIGRLPMWAVDCAKDQGLLAPEDELPVRPAVPPVLTNGFIAGLDAESESEPVGALTQSRQANIDSGTLRSTVGGVPTVAVSATSLRGENPDEGIAELHEDEVLAQPTAPTIAKPKRDSRAERAAQGRIPPAWPEHDPIANVPHRDRAATLIDLLETERRCDLTPAETLVLAALRVEQDRTGAFRTHTVAELGRRAGVARETAWRALQALISKGAVRADQLPAALGGTR